MQEKSEKTDQKTFEESCREIKAALFPYKRRKGEDTDFAYKKEVSVL